MLGLKLNHVSKRGHCTRWTIIVSSWRIPLFYVRMRQGVRSIGGIWLLALIECKLGPVFRELHQCPQALCNNWYYIHMHLDLRRFKFRRHFFSFCVQPHQQNQWMGFAWLYDYTSWRSVCECVRFLWNVCLATLGELLKWAFIIL